MNENIIDIIAMTIADFQTKGKTKTMAMKAMRSRGFSDKEISIAFSWLADKLDKKFPSELVDLQTHTERAFRLFDAEEQEYFTPNAYNDLIRYISIGLIGSEHIDIMLEKINMFMVSKITSKMLKQFIASYIFDAPFPEQTGSSSQLSGNATIN